MNFPQNRYTGRRTLEDTMDLIEREFHPAKVVYGDTDSVFVQLPNVTSLQAAFAIGEDIVKRVTARHPWPMELELEKVYWPCCLVSKKRYVGMAYSSPAQKVATFDAKGIETVRRDTLCRVRNFYYTNSPSSHKGDQIYLGDKNVCGADVWGCSYVGRGGGVVLAVQIGERGSNLQTRTRGRFGCLGSGLFLLGDGG